MILVSLVIPTLCYIFTGISFAVKKDYPHALIFLCYALANMGFIWYEWNKFSS